MCVVPISWHLVLAVSFFQDLSPPFCPLNIILDIVFCLARAYCFRYLYHNSSARASDKHILFYLQLCLGSENSVCLAFTFAACHLP